MNKKEAIEELKGEQENQDFESAHINADRILCDFLESRGYRDVVEAWQGVGKWYA